MAFLKDILGIIIVWVPAALLIILAANMGELGLANPPSQGSSDRWPLLLGIGGGVGWAFIFSFGRRPGHFLDKFLNNMLKI